MSKLLIIGAGGHGRVVADCAQATGKYKEIVFLDSHYPNTTQNLTWQIIGHSDQWPNYLTSHDIAVAVGDNTTRLSLFKQLVSKNARLPNIIHPSAVVSPTAHMGDGNVVFANGVINPSVTLGNACIINTGATVDHDCQLADAVHISPGANLSGTVTVNEGCWFGVGSCAIQSIAIAQYCHIGAGAAVTKPTQAYGLYVGVPAKRIKDLLPNNTI